MERTAPTRISHHDSGQSDRVLSQQQPVSRSESKTSMDSIASRKKAHHDTTNLRKTTNSSKGRVSLMARQSMAASKVMSVRNVARKLQHTKSFARPASSDLAPGCPFKRGNLFCYTPDVHKPFKVRMTKYYCVLRGNELRCYANVNQTDKSLMKVPMLQYNTVVSLPITVENGVERMKLCKGDPDLQAIPFRLQVHSGESLEYSWSGKVMQDELYSCTPHVFVAESVRETKLWKDAMLSAMWYHHELYETRSMISLSSNNPAEITSHQVNMQSSVLCVDNKRESKLSMDSKQESIANLNKQGSVSNLKKQGSVANLKKQGSVVNLKKQGSVANLKKQGSVVNLKKQGSVVNLKKQGSVVNLKKQGSVANLKKQGSVANVSKNQVSARNLNIEQGSLANLNMKQGSASSVRSKQGSIQNVKESITPQRQRGKHAAERNKNAVIVKIHLPCNITNIVNDTCACNSRIKNQPGGSRTAVFVGNGDTSTVRDVYEFVREVTGVPCFQQRYLKVGSDKLVHFPFTHNSEESLNAVFQDWYSCLQLQNMGHPKQAESFITFDQSKQILHQSKDRLSWQAVTVFNYV